MVVIVIQSGDCAFRIIGPFEDANKAEAFAVGPSSKIYPDTWEIRPIHSPQTAKAAR